MKNTIRLLGCLALACIVAGCEPAALDEPAAVPDTKPAAKAPTYKVEKGPFKIEVTCKGVFEAADMAEVSLNPEAWGPMGGGPLTVLKAIEHGTPVRKGEVLINLDLEKIDRAVHDLENEITLGELAIKQAERELPVLERTTPVDLAAAERAKKIADEDLRRFIDQDREWSEKLVQFRVKNARNFLEYEQEELKQLEKMYRAKDLTEETEEIILKRQRNYVEMYTFFFRTAEYDRDQRLKVALPREEQKLKESAVQTGLALDKARATLPLALNKKQLDLKKLRYEQEKSSDRLAKLRRDRELMTVKSPADGIAYYGKCDRGKWDSAAAASKLRAGGTLMAHEVFLTVVKSRPLFVRAVVEEKDLPHIHAGSRAKVAPAADSDAKLSGQVDRVSSIPITPGNFEARIAVELGKDAEALMPGMACTVKLVAYRRADAVSVPAAAVFADDLDEDRHYVYLVRKHDKPEKRPVVVGKKAGDKLEILQGLQEGDEILRDKPSADKNKEGA